MVDGAGVMVLVGDLVPEGTVIVWSLGIVSVFVTIAVEVMSAESNALARNQV